MLVRPTLTEDTGPSLPNEGLSELWQDRITCFQYFKMHGEKDTFAQKFCR